MVFLWFSHGIPNFHGSPGSSPCPKRLNRSLRDATMFSCWMIPFSPSRFESGLSGLWIHFLQWSNQICRDGISKTIAKRGENGGLMGLWMRITNWAWPKRKVYFQHTIVRIENLNSAVTGFTARNIEETKGTKDSFPVPVFSFEEKDGDDVSRWLAWRIWARVYPLIMTVT